MACQARHRSTDGPRWFLRAVFLGRAAVEPDSAVSVRIQYDSVAAVAVEGMVTDFVVPQRTVVPL